MSNAIHDAERRIELNEALRTIQIGQIVKNDKNANRIVLELLKDRKPAELAGYSVTGKFINRENVVVPLEGTIEGNILTVTFNEGCYVIPGMAGGFIIVSNADASDIVTVAKFTAEVLDDGGDKIYDPDHMIGSVTELLAKIAAMEKATADGLAAAAEARSAAAEAVGIANAAGQEAKNVAQEAADKADAAREAIQGDLSSLKENKAPAIEVEASGAIVTVDDAAAMAVHGLVSQIVPVQSGSGDPSPDNERKISGWTKVNAVRAKKNLYGGLYLANDFAAKINASVIDAEAKTVSYTSQSIAAKILYDSFKPGTQYTAIVTLTAESTGTTANMRFLYADGTRSDAFRLVDTTDGKKQAVVVSAAGKSVDRLVGVMFSGVQYLLYEESGIFEGVMTADEFVPFDGENISAALPETVYGGQLDWLTGVLTVDSAMLTIDGSMVNKWDVASNGIPDVEILDDRATRDCVVCCDRYKNSTVAAESAIRGWTERFWVYDSRFVDEDTAINILNDEMPQVVFKIKKPYTIQLTPQQMDMLKGVNNVWSDSGDTSLVYVADTKDWGKGASTALIGATESGMVATKNYSIGDFIVNKDDLTMYRATAAIAKGEAITPGMNCAATTVVEQLAALYNLINA